MNSRDIPDGYCETKHKNLGSSIAKEGDLSFLASNTLTIMACHETNDAHCIGWLVNQLGVGNNIGIRLEIMNCENADKIQVIGEQHDTFLDTLPKPLRQGEITN